MIDFLKFFKLESCSDNRRKKKLKLTNDEKINLTSVIAKGFLKSKTENFLFVVKIENLL